MEIPFPLSLQNLSLKPKQIQLKAPKYWSSIIKHYAKLKNDQAILTTYTHMESLGISPDSTSMPLVFKACSRVSAIEKGIQIHSSILGTDLITDVRVGTALVDFYCKFGFIDEASKVFDELSDRDLVSWNALIFGYVACCYFKEAVLLFVEMQNEGLKPNSRTVVALLMACGEASELKLGQEIHGYCLSNGLFDLDPHVGTALIGFYMRFNVMNSHLVFNMMAVKNVVSWNSIITGYFDAGDHLKALKLFLNMITDGVEFDSVTMLVVIQACSENRSIKLGMQIHQIAIKFDFVEDLFILNALVNMYKENGCFQSSYALFHSVPTKDVALWNSMLCGFIEYGFYEEAIEFFTKMRIEGIRVDVRTVVIMLSLSKELTENSLALGKSLHANVRKVGMKMDVSLGNALLSMYVEQNQIEDARKVFHEIRGVDVISWNSLIMLFARNKLRDEAWEYFQTMRATDIKPNSYTMISLLASCEDESDLKSGRVIHCFVIRNGIEMNTSLNTALTVMYMNCCGEAKGRILFDSCLHRDLISWNALIASYVRNDKSDEALSFFRRMVISEVVPNSATIVNILASCTHLAYTPLGQCLHAYVTRRQKTSICFDISLANAFITMYTRCGRMEYAEMMFRALPRRNIVSWNAMITGYGMHGRGNDAVIAFLKMIEDGLEPNKISFLSVLSACSHSGLIEMGLKLFNSMVEDFNITPELAHYGSVVDLLGRGGRLAEAKEFISSMPIEPDGSIWRALLSACRVKCEIKLAEAVFEKLVELEPSNPGNYVLISNIYAASGLWSEAAGIRRWLKERELDKTPGSSWIVVRDQVHSFTSGDVTHVESEMIYANLNRLSFLIKEVGYVTDFYCY